MCVDGDAVMMNKGVTATVSVDSYAVCCTLLLIFYRMMLFLLVHCPVVLD